VGRLSIYFEDMELDPHHPWRAALDLALPRVRHLFISSDFHARELETSALITLLTRCSTILERFQINITIPHKNRKDSQAQQRTEDEPEAFPSLKELDLGDCIDKSDSKTFWPWLSKRCGRVEKIVINSAPVPVENLARCMLDHMPKLNEITLGKYRARTGITTDGMAATLLSGSRSGWKVVRLGPYARFGGSTTDALMAHLSTLQVVEVRGRDFSSNDLIEVLRSCTNLHTLSITDLSFDPTNRRLPFSAEVFVDQCHDTESLKAWKCEVSVRVLKVRIAGIPRQGQKESWKDTNLSRQGREIQQRVYERLARFTNLETLWLGTCDQGRLGMSVGSGLEKLSSLKKLKELGVRGMYRTKLDMKETLWMIEHWPRLCSIVGFRSASFCEAIEWMEMNHPQISRYNE